MGGSRVSTVSKAATIEEIGEFWDTHDFSELDPGGPDVQFEVRCAVPVEADLLESVEAEARRRGVGVETLVNLWLQEKVAGCARVAPA